jgi:PTS system nitrogen regulatory IIA component
VSSEDNNGNGISTEKHYTRREAPSSPAIEPLIDANEAAELLGIHPVTLCEMARQGRIPAIKIGRVWRFRPSSLNRWLSEREQRQRQDV